MKKLIIGALVGAVLLFIWQFLSWGLLRLHSEMQQYTPKQTEIMKYLNENLEEGFYYMPNMPPNTPADQEQKLMEESIGKPFAQVYMHKALNMNMGMNMARGLFVNFIALLLIIWVLMKIGRSSFQEILLCCLAIGIIGYLTLPYTYSIWYQTKTMADLIDAVASWGLVGVWLGWWLNRNN